ncbi:hypothetical protein ISCGN_032876 [Ixodes scapularis]
MPPKTRSTPNRDEDDSSESGTQEPPDAAGAGEGSSTRASPDAAILPPAPAGGAADIGEFMRAMTAMMKTFSRQIATAPRVASAAPTSLPRPRLSVPTPTYAGYFDTKSVHDFLQDLDALQPYLEDSGKLPTTMAGFRPHLSTQDILLQIKEEVMAPATRNPPTALLALDLKGAFDNVKHSAILQRLNTLGCGARTYHYIRDFLSDRKAILKVGDQATDPFPLGGRGTPQGAVLSPLLFNIALIGLPPLLDNIPGIRHGLYADDITIWSSTGSIGAMESRLLDAADVVNAYPKSCGLSCAPQKSELLLVSPRKQHPPGSPTITIHLEGHTIAPSRSVKILGMIFQADRNNSILMKRLQTTIDQVTHMIRRIATKTRGMGEKDTLRLVQAFVVSRITYAIPYALLNSTELKTLDIMIRKAYKQAMGLPTSTSTERLLRLGVHNTAEELIEAHLSNQRARLGVKTRVLRRTLSPVYDEDFTFYGINPNQLQATTLHFVVLSFDRYSRDDVIGEVVCSMAGLDTEHLDKTLALSREIAPRHFKIRSQGRGELLVSLCHQPAANRLTVVVLKARNLPKVDITGLSDPYVKIYLLYNQQRIAKKKTHIKKRTVNPVFNESFVFEVPYNEGLDNLSLEFLVLDWDRVTKNEVVGRLELGPRGSPAAQQHWLEVCNSPRRQIAEWHKLRE